jgi:hypothetical protein
MIQADKKAQDKLKKEDKKTQEIKKREKDW